MYRKGKERKEREEKEREEREGKRRKGRTREGMRRKGKKGKGREGKGGKGREEKGSIPPLKVSRHQYGYTNTRPLRQYPGVYHHFVFLIQFGIKETEKRNPIPLS
jgi:hypothetical protein